MGVVNSEVPTWMAEIKAEQDAARLQADIEAKDRALVEALMRTEDPREIWERLKAKLEKIAGLSEKTIGIRISINDISSRIEPAVRVEASVPGINRIGEARSVYTDVFFSLAEYRIRCLNQMEEEFTYYKFCTANNALWLCLDSRPITPEKAASDIIEHVVSVLRSFRN